MNPMAIILSTGQLGGAERSLIEQVSTFANKSNLKVFTPELGRDKNHLDEFLQSKGMDKSIDIAYPKFLYKTSRKSGLLNILSLVQLPLLFFYGPVYFWKFRKFSVFYLNGNKAALPFFLMAIFIKRETRVYWHFRDYPDERFFKWSSVILSRFLEFKNNHQLILIGNSHSVTSELDKFFPRFKCHTVYNLPGSDLKMREVSQISHIGIVSMFAPWKGLHTVVLMIGMFGKELKELGIKKISVFGEDIYLTDGPHSGYKKSILKLKEKFGIDLIIFQGNQSPQNIFSSIDLLIHPSIRLEPFGRVIVEAQKSGVPVISTALGGANELIANGCGKKILCYDYFGMFLAIKNLIEDPKLKNQIIGHAIASEKAIESQIREKISQLFS